jgi:sugar/nucleoside kinase (ribokinase family)
VGKVGGDILGDFVIRDMEGRGIDITGITKSSRSQTSSTIIIPVRGEDRRYIHVVGANDDLRSEDFDLEMVAACRVLYVGGYLLMSGLNQKSVSKLFKFAQERGTITVLDVIVPAGFHGIMEDTLAEVLPYTDVFLPNNDEALLLTGRDDPLEQVRIFSELGCRISVVTMGERGTLAMGGGQTLIAPPFSVDVIDPSGAGDAFDAGFIWGMLEKWDLRKILIYASALGASACLRLGATSSVFTKKQIDAFLAKNVLELEVL